jgi:hypothetical protein
MRADSVCTYWRAIQRRAQEATSEWPFCGLISSVTGRPHWPVYIVCKREITAH